MKKFFVFLLILLLILGGVGFWGYQKLTEFVHTPVNVTQDQLLTIERGTTGSKLAALLEQEKILERIKKNSHLMIKYSQTGGFESDAATA